MSRSLYFLSSRACVSFGSIDASSMPRGSAVPSKSEPSPTWSTPATFTLTLTARDGTVPLTIRNDSGVPLHVTVRLRSQKLEFPDGDTIDQVSGHEWAELTSPPIFHWP